MEDGRGLALLHKKETSKMSILGVEMTIIIELYKYLIAEFLHAVKVDLSLNNFLILQIEKSPHL